MRTSTPISSTSGRSSGHGSVPERPGLRRSISFNDPSNEDGMDDGSQPAAQVETSPADGADSSSDRGHTDQSHPFRDESFPPPDVGSVAARAEAYAEAFLENESVEFQAPLTESDGPPYEFERQARSLALDLLQHHALRLGIHYPEDSLFFQIGAHRVAVRAHGNDPYAHSSRSLHRPHRRYKLALFRHDKNGSSSPDTDDRTSSSDETRSDESSESDINSTNPPRKLRAPPPDNIQQAIVGYVAMYIACQDEIVEWVASGDMTRAPYFPRLDQPGTPEYEASTDARVWALDNLEQMAWDGRVRLPHPAAFFANCNELMRHADRWQFQFPYIQAVVNGEESPTPVRSGEPHPELGPRPCRTLLIEAAETVETAGTVVTSRSDETDFGPLLNDPGTDDLPLRLDDEPNPNPDHHGPPRRLDLYGNIIENPAEYWDYDERILSLDEPPAPPPYGLHQQDEPHLVNERSFRIEASDLVIVLNNDKECHSAHGIPPDYGTRGRPLARRYAPPPPTTEPRLNLLGEPITPRNSPPRVANSAQPGLGDNISATLHAAFATRPPRRGTPALRTRDFLGFASHTPPNTPSTPALTIRNGVPSPERPPSPSTLSWPPDFTLGSPAAHHTTPVRLTTPPSSTPSPNFPPHPPPTPIAIPSFASLSDSSPPISPPRVPIPPSLPSSPVLLPPLTPTSSPNDPGPLDSVPRLPALSPDLSDADSVPASPPPGYASRETSPPETATRLRRPRAETVVCAAPMRWPETGEETRREWGRERFVRGDGERGGRWRLRRRGTRVETRSGEGVWVVGEAQGQGHWEGWSQGRWESDA
ncbi:hypothetical protein MMC26_006015 [Xylographa opegraphella]|nr:hypothetical protein [Xylographa opegraphella]